MEVEEKKALEEEKKESENESKKKRRSKRFSAFVHENIIKQIGFSRRITIGSQPGMSEENYIRLQKSYRHPFLKIPPVFYAEKTR